MECLTTTRAVSFELTVTAHTTSTQTLSVMINMSNDEKQAKEQSKITYFACVHHPADTVLPRLVSLTMILYNYEYTLTIQMIV